MRKPLSRLRIGAAFLSGMLLLASPLANAQNSRRKVILDQDSMGPAASNLLAILVAVQSPEVEVLGITVESGDGWQAENVAHVLRMLELIGRPDIPVYRGSTYPLVNTMEATERWESMYGDIAYKGAWMKKWPEYNKAERTPYHDANVVPPLKEGETHLHAAEGTAADFLVREVHRYPGEVSILALGPLTNIALAVRLDDDFASLAKDFVLMGASLNPMAPKRDEYSLQFLFSPRSNFNFRWDPEAAKIALRAPFKRIVVVPTDATVETAFSNEMLKEISKSPTLVAKYVADYPYIGMPMWDELTVAVWLKPSLIARSERLSMDVETNSGSSGYGDTLTWRPGKGPGLGEPVVEAIRAVDVPAFNAMFVKLLSQPAPNLNRRSGSLPWPQER
jgi:purine nucleosidase